MASKKSNIPESSSEFLTFFENEVERLEAEIKRIDEMQVKLHEFTERYENAFGTKGAAHYFLESTRNELQAASQKQSLIRDIRDLRKMALDYSMRLDSGDENESFSALTKKLNEMVAIMRINDRTVTSKTIDDDAAYDEAIERRLNEGN